MIDILAWSVITLYLLMVAVSYMSKDMVEKGLEGIRFPHLLIIASLLLSANIVFTFGFSVYILWK